MAPGGLDAEAVSIQNQTRRILAYCHPRMVLTMGSTLIRWVAKGDPVGQRQFIHTIFGVAA